MSDKMIDKLVDRAPLAIIVIGVFVFIVGAAGGLPVGNPPLQISDPFWRIGLGILGIILATVGLLLLFREVAKPTDGSSDNTGLSKTNDWSPNQIHRYSGIWTIQNSFSRWRRRNITEPDQVSFDGKTMLVIPIDGKGGVGVQVGRLKVRIDSYRATYEIVNEIQNASIDKDEILRMQVKVIRRQLIEEVPPAPKNTNTKDPYADLRGGLENPNFLLELKPVANTPLQLEGFHRHEDALSQDQVASEKYVYQGLFTPPGL